MGMDRWVDLGAWHPDREARYDQRERIQERIDEKLGACALGNVSAKNALHL